MTDALDALAKSFRRLADAYFIPDMAPRTQCSLFGARFRGHDRVWFGCAQRDVDIYFVPEIRFEDIWDEQRALHGLVLDDYTRKAWPAHGGALVAVRLDLQ